jgi:hypothetical protein
MLMGLSHQIREGAEAARKEKKQPEFSWKEYDRSLGGIQGVINEGIITALNREVRPSGEELQNELREAVGLDINAKNKAAAFSFETPTQKLYIVAYALGTLVANSRSWVGVFGPQGHGRRYALLASVENSLPDKTIAIQPLGHSGKSGLTFLAYGINWGDAHNRLTVIAYAFGGKTLKAIWSRSDLPQGQLSVQDGSITLNFLSSPLGPGHKSVHSVTEIYRLTSGQIRLESTEPTEKQTTRD